MYIVYKLAYKLKNLKDDQKTTNNKEQTILKQEIICQEGRE